MRNILAIFRKQIKDTLKNATVLIQFVMFPALTFVMNHAIQIDGMPENFFVHLFATMYIGMAPLTSMAAIISEEKEKGTLRVLMMSNVRPFEYLLGIGIYVWSMCMLGAAFICVSGGYNLQTGVAFMGVMAMGFFVSLLTGAAIGTWSKAQMTATSLAVPVMMIFSFMPMISMFNTTIAEIAKFTYTGQISLMLNRIDRLQIDAENFIIVVMNISVASALFVAAYKKCRLA